MKQRLIALRARLDALKVRERVLVFGAVLALLIFVFDTLVLTPLQAREAALRTQLLNQRNEIAAIDTEIAALVERASVDPDKDARAHLAALQADSSALSQSLREIQTGLVEPERMAPLIESLLKANGRLQLVSLKTLPATVMNGTPPPAAPAPPATVPGISPGLAALVQGGPAPAATAAPGPAQTQVAQALALLYRHGVEVTVRGNYLDMVDYLATLEAMPDRLYWGRAALTVEQYPNSRLTLTVYTLSLDQKWMKL